MNKYIYVNYYELNSDIQTDCQLIIKQLDNETREEAIHRIFSDWWTDRTQTEDKASCYIHNRGLFFQGATVCPI